MRAFPVHMRPPNYLNDGNGRDTYISFANGGFSNYPYSRAYKKDNYGSYRSHFFPDLSQRRPIVKYGIEGTGREYFIYQSSVSEHNRDLGSTLFSNTLRESQGYGPLITSNNFRTSKFEKNLIGRVFYGKCPGVKDRLMCPKTQFRKKEMKVSTSENVLPEIKSFCNTTGNLDSCNHSKDNRSRDGDKDIERDEEIKEVNEDYENERNKNGDVMKKILGKSENKIKKGDIDNFRGKTLRRSRDNFSSDNMVQNLRTLFLFNSKKKGKTFKNIRVNL